MKRTPRTPLEAKFVANLQAILPVLLGEPEQDDGREYVFHDAVGKVAITYSLEDPSSTGVFVRRHDNFGGAGFDLLELFDLTEDDVAEVFDQLALGAMPEQAPVGNNEARSAPTFREVLATARDDDGRIDRYLAGRCLPGMAHHVRLVTMKGGRLGMAAIAIDHVIKDPLALQVLPIDSVGRPAQVGDKKVRRTYASIRGWTRDASFLIPGVEGGPVDVVMVEGAEDALSVRAAGWTGPVVATLGKGNIAKHSPPGRSVVLCFDADVPQHEVDDALEAHKRAGRTVRIAKLPEGTDPNDLVRAGRGEELLALLTGSQEASSKVVEIEKVLLSYPFDDAGHARYMVDRRDLAKRFKVAAAYLDQVRARLSQQHNPDAEPEVQPIIRDITPATYPVDGADLFNRLLSEINNLVVFGKEDAEKPSGAVAAALWVMSSHCFDPFPANNGTPDDLFDHAPRLMISAGTIRSGKTRLLETVACLGRRILRGSNLSAAVLFRAIERYRPMVMLDEVDHARLAEDGNALVQLINDGFEPNGAAWRVGGEKNERLDCFRVFTPVALCGIGRLPSATEDRCVRIVLVRKPTSRRLRRLDKSRKKKLNAMAPEILRWVRDFWKILVQNLEPAFPEGIDNDRDEDLWRPLLAIADTIGGEVPELARKAMVELVAVAHEPSAGEELMTAIYKIVTLELAERPAVTKIALIRLVGMVNAVEGPWSELRGGIGCDSRWLSKQLKAFSLSWRNVRDPVHGTESTSGYDLFELLKVSVRYHPKSDEGDAESPASEKSPTSPTSPTGYSNPLNDTHKTASDDVGQDVGVGDRGATTKGKRVNPITGKARVGEHARPTSSARPTHGAADKTKKTTEKSESFVNGSDDVGDVGHVGHLREGGPAPSPSSFSDPIPGVGEPLPIDLSQLAPGDLLPGRLKVHGYSLGPAPGYELILPPGFPADRAAKAMELARQQIAQHRAAAWARLLKHRNGGANG